MNNHPIIKVTLAFILGIILQNLLASTIFILLIFAIIILIFFVLFLTSSNDTLKIVSAYLLIILLSGLHYELYSNNDPDRILNKSKYSRAILFGEVKSKDLIKEGSLTFIVRADSFLYKGEMKLFSGDIRCRIYDSTFSNLNELNERILIGNYVKLKGTLVRPKGIRNPGEFDYSGYLAGLNIYGIINSYNISDLEIINNNENILENIIYNIRQGINKNIIEFHDTDTQGLLKGLILADKSSIDYQVRTAFMNAGVIHVLAVSGLHVGYIVLIFLLLFSRFNIYIKSTLTIVGILFFLIITGSPASVFRASVMSIVVILSIITNRGNNIFNSLSIAALILLLLNPTEIFNPGFQLSFAAVISIALIMPYFKAKIERFKTKRFIKSLLLFASVSLAAQIGTLPLTIYYFGKIPLISLIANIFVIPLIGMILAVGIATISIGNILPIIADIYGEANNFFTLLLFEIVRLFGNENFLLIKITNFSFLDSIQLIIMIISIFLFTKYFTGAIKKTIFISLLILIFFVYSSFDNKDYLKANNITLTAIDVGQGDSYLVTLEDGYTILFDGGAATKYFDSGERIISPLLNFLGIEQIDLCIVTHTDNDHSGGIPYLAKKGLISNLIKPIVDSTNYIDVYFESILKKYNVKIEHYKKGIIKTNNTRIYILGLEDMINPLELDNNNRSVIAKIVYGNTEILMTGDAEKPVEKLLVKKYGKFLDSDILKVGHHGSATGTSKEFLHFVSPELAIISCGQDNKFNHPSREVIEQLENNAIKTLRTDSLGAIIIHSDGNEITNYDWR